MKKEIEFIENIDLIKNNFVHILHEFELSEPSYFRIALESHNALLRTMVEVLRGTSNAIVTNKFSDRGKKMVFKVGDNPEFLIKKVNVDGCNYAWRFSSPQEIKNYKINDDAIRDIEDNNYLIGFYDLLAMIQCDYFMKYYTQAKTIEITDTELSDLEWLHQEIRNKYEHFVPKSYGAPIHDLLYASQICIKICAEILINSNNIYFLYDDKLFKEFISKIKQKINSSFINKN